MKNLQAVIIAFAGILLAACTTPRTAAPVVERVGSQKAVVIPKAASVPSTDAKGYYTVRRGDTLYRIALEHGQNYRDIVAWNGLANPNDIKIDQVLRVAPLDAPSGVSPNGVAGSNIEVRPLTSPSTPPATSSVVTTNKTSPRGEKRPYSDSALADLQNTEPNTVAVTVPPLASLESNKQIDTTVAKPSVTPVPSEDDENFAWIWPAEGRILASFDDNKKGIDIAGKAGQQIVAAGPGKVMYAGSGIRGYGNLVIIKHTNTLLSAYAHNKAILVKEGQTVTRGQKIAEMGNSDSDATKLHFEIRQQGKPVDPSKFLPGR